MMFTLMESGSELKEIARTARLRLLQMHYESGVGHIGGNLSCLDLILCLYHKILRPTDSFILSKGHAAGAMYVTLWTVGKLGEHDLHDFHRDGTRLSGHPAPNAIPEILFATGSLGHGLPLAVGLALGKQLRGEPGRVFCLTSDGEWNEGSCWEALIFARQRELENLRVIVDLNNLQGFGRTHEVADLYPLPEKFRAFRVATDEIDGHDHDSILQALEAGNGLRATIAKTVKGKGISFMEDRMDSHYVPLTHEQYLQAVQEISRP